MKTVLITGGSRGIGADLVCRFARDGYAVAFVYHKAHEAAASVARETGAFAICADISMPDEARRAVAEAKEKLGHIDVLINNAAVSKNVLSLVIKNYASLVITVCYFTVLIGGKHTDLRHTNDRSVGSG
jgi:NAD(P)-dependent dehydrogenase (short-subunit alcohol dehydrogenase family)